MVANLLRPHVPETPRVLPTSARGLRALPQPQALLPAPEGASLKFEASPPTSQAAQRSSQATAPAARTPELGRPRGARGTSCGRGRSLSTARGALPPARGTRMERARASALRSTVLQVPVRPAPAPPLAVPAGEGLRKRSPRARAVALGTILGRGPWQASGPGEQP